MNRRCDDVTETNPHGIRTFVQVVLDEVFRKLLPSLDTSLDTSRDTLREMGRLDARLRFVVDRGRFPVRAPMRTAMRMSAPNNNTGHEKIAR